MSPRRFLQRILPQRSLLTEHRRLRFLGERLHDPDLWHLSRRSVAGGLAAGLFVACLPVPFHMLIAVPLALALRVNLPIAALSVWVTNPITMPALLWLEYKLGAWLLGVPANQEHFALTWHWLTETALQIWQPLLLGSLLCATLAAVVTNVSVRMLWRLHLVNRWRNRRARSRPG
ncbi:MAG: DUF2062 domain-containing protein [Gammaproteobacteria bacterium]|nr:DUF2062 domain-containing protein [Gammaproteobacteria bacterium]